MQKSLNAGAGVKSEQKGNVLCKKQACSIKEGTIRKILTVTNDTIVGVVTCVTDTYIEILCDLLLTTLDESKLQKYTFTHLGRSTVLINVNYNAISKVTYTRNLSRNARDVLYKMYVMYKQQNAQAIAMTADMFKTKLNAVFDKYAEKIGFALEGINIYKTQNITQNITEIWLRESIFTESFGNRLNTEILKSYGITDSEFVPLVDFSHTDVSEKASTYTKNSQLHSLYTALLNVFKTQRMLQGVNVEYGLLWVFEDVKGVRDAISELPENCTEYDNGIDGILRISITQQEYSMLYAILVKQIMLYVRK